MRFHKINVADDTFLQMFSEVIVTTFDVSSDEDCPKNYQNLKKTNKLQNFRKSFLQNQFQHTKPPDGEH